MDLLDIINLLNAINLPDECLLWRLYMDASNRD